MNLKCNNFNGLFDYIKESIPGVNFEKEDERYDIYNVFYKLDDTTVLLATVGKYLCAYNEAVIMCHSLKDPLIMSNLSDKKAILEYLESCILLLEKNDYVHPKCCWPTKKNDQNWLKTAFNPQTP